MSAETEKIQSRYNGEFDLIQGGPMVTWAEYELAVAVEMLERKIASIEKLIEEKNNARDRD